MKKRIISLVLVLAMLLTLPLAAGALAPEDAADRLHSLGLFQGVGNNEDGTPNFALENAPNRAQAIAMFVRLIGMAEYANDGEWETPFTDVPYWAEGYVGFAYEYGLTNGVSDTLFGSASRVSAAQYLTFILRALDYVDGEDFEWDSAWELADEKGITDGQFPGATQFLRGDVAWISFNALSATFADSDEALYEVLIYLGVFTAEQWEAAQAPKAPDNGEDEKDEEDEDYDDEDEDEEDLDDEDEDEENEEDEDEDGEEEEDEEDAE